MTSTSAPVGGDLAKGGVEGSGSVAPGSSIAGAADAGMQSQTAHYYILKLKGEVIGQFENTVAVPGLTFGWGPTNSGLIAFANLAGHVVIMDDQGRKQEVQGRRPRSFQPGRRTASGWPTSRRPARTRRRFGSSRSHNRDNDHGRMDRAGRTHGCVGGHAEPCAVIPIPQPADLPHVDSRRRRRRRRHRRRVSSSPA